MHPCNSFNHCYDNAIWIVLTCYIYYRQMCLPKLLGKTTLVIYFLHVQDTINLCLKMYIIWLTLFALLLNTHKRYANIYFIEQPK